MHTHSHHTHLHTPHTLRRGFTVFTTAVYILTVLFGFLDKQTKADESWVSRGVCQPEKRNMQCLLTCRALFHARFMQLNKAHPETCSGLQSSHRDSAGNRGLVRRRPVPLMDLGREEGQGASARGQANQKKGNQGAVPYWFIKKKKQEGRNLPSSLPLWPLLTTFSGLCTHIMFLGFPGGSTSREPACNAGDPGSIPGLERSQGKGNGNPLQYSCLENSMDRETSQSTVHGVAKYQTDWATNTFACFAS